MMEQTNNIKSRVGLREQIKDKNISYSGKPLTNKDIDDFVEIIKNIPLQTEIIQYMGYKQYLAHTENDNSLTKEEYKEMDEAIKEQIDTNYLSTDLPLNNNLTATFPEPTMNDELAKYFWSLPRTQRRKMIKKEAKWRYYVYKTLFKVKIV